MVPRPSTKGYRTELHNIVHLSYRSVFGRWFKSQAPWGQDNPHYPEKFDEAVYNAVIDDVLKVLTVYGYVEPTDLDGDRQGYRIDSSILEWCLAEDAGEGDSPTNQFFPDLVRERRGTSGQRRPPLSPT